jgi:hypothetical protein
MKILLDTGAYAGFKRNEYQSLPTIFGLQRKLWSMEPTSSHPTNTSRKLMAWSIQSFE